MQETPFAKRFHAHMLLNFVCCILFFVYYGRDFADVQCEQPLQIFVLVQAIAFGFGLVYGALTRFVVSTIAICMMRAVDPTQSAIQSCRSRRTPRRGCETSRRTGP